MKQIVKEVGELVKKEFSTEEVILFGSFASGEPSPSSDLDILVIMDTKLKPYKQSSLIRMRLDEKLGVKVPIDLIVRTPQQISERLNLGDFFIKNILTKGVHL
jgi:predicted nucleotidyltransferase